ncbi:hypothetical protein C8R45DRAFT_416601 [Mycena sanguinolenta]|nr:hypothetical protein C8R45DRAFT_416601 [Mycena sanguinolenta]
MELLQYPAPCSQCSCCILSPFYDGSCDPIKLPHRSMHVLPTAGPRATTCQYRRAQLHACLRCRRGLASCLTLVHKRRCCSSPPRLVLPIPSVALMPLRTFLARARTCRSRRLASLAQDRNPPTQFILTRQRTPFPGQGTQRTPERRPWHASHTRGVVSCRIGGRRSQREGSFRTPELALDVKRLLAKPVSLSAPSVVSHAKAESTSAADGPALRRKRYDTAGSRVERVEEEGFNSWSEDGHLPPRRSEDGKGTGARTTEEGSGGCTGVYGSAQRWGGQGEEGEASEKRPGC